MEYQAKQAVYLPVTDFLNLEFHFPGSVPPIAGRGLTKG
jgi:hypothetical protein